LAGRARLMSQTAQLIGDLRSPDEDLPGVVSIRREARHFERQASNVSAASASIPAQPAQPAQPFGRLAAVLRKNGKPV
jgi:hypothetical protein